MAHSYQQTPIWTAVFKYKLYIVIHNLLLIIQGTYVVGDIDKVDLLIIVSLLF